MNMTVPLLERIKLEYRNTNQEISESEYIVLVWNLATSIEAKKADINRKMAELTKQYEENMGLLRKELSELTKDCRHWVTDSCTSPYESEKWCVICGALL